jgi:hypothetical protein
MTVATARGVALGTDETTGVTIANNATTVSNEIDFSGADSAECELFVFLKFTSTVTVGTVDVILQPSAISGQTYDGGPWLLGTFAPINGTLKIPVNQPYAPIRPPRYGKIAVKNNATGANITNVTVRYEALRLS